MKIDKSLYIHIPFCRSKCLYCSFAVSVGQMQHCEAYLRCVDQEASVHAGMKFGSMYVGGGTPTEMEAGSIVQLFGIIKKRFLLAPDAEVTFEANPEGLTEMKASLLKESGVNRLSIGVQTWNDLRLRDMGRVHDSAQAYSAIATARKAGFNNINIDLIFGLPGQTDAEISSDLDVTLSLSPEHVSIYQLTIEANSRFYVNRVRLDDDQTLAVKYERIIERLVGKGYVHYEVSNFARPGKSSRHNIHYWQGGDYIGLGAGAHSHVGGHRYWNEPQLLRYLKCFGPEGSAVVGEERLNAHQRLIDSLLFGLRMSEGVNVKELEVRFGADLGEGRRYVLESLLRDGFLTMRDAHLAATRKGLLVLDEICARLV